VQARIAQTPTSTGTPRQGFHCAAWHATRLSRDVLSRGVKLHKEVLLPREVSLTREVMRPREVADQGSDAAQGDIAAQESAGKQA